ncbi:ATP-binding protein [Streptomyces sp. NPDC050548]|uniref:ATP-binding protein n=1 Tax=Streptomyces sp. NPDC050548 TaxID=3365629 RepID=UPI00378A69B0
MSFWIQAGATAVPWVAALAGGSAAWHYRGSAGAHERAAERSRRQSQLLAEQLRAVEEAVGTLARDVVPALRAQAAGGGRQDGFPLSLPGELIGSPVADQLGKVAEAVAQAVRQVRHESDIAGSAQVAEVQRAAEAAAAESRRTAEETTRAAVRGVASSLVAIASRLSRQVSAGVRKHAGDEAYASLVTIDRHGQQLLLAAQSYVVLSGGKLSRRWPDSSVTDVVRAAMGHLDQFERIEHEESDTAVTARAVGPVIHALALLLDNALRYSPQTARVEIRLHEGHHGMTVAIDDAGLGMSLEQLRAARRILSADQLNDVTRLGAQPSVGFRVVAALGRDYGFQADVEAPNHYHGVRALLFLPNALLTTLTPDTPVAPVSPAPAPAPAARPAATTANGLAVRQRRTHASTTGPAIEQDEHTPAQPGRPEVAAAWARGIARARSASTPTTSNGERPS